MASNLFNEPRNKPCDTAFQEEVKIPKKDKKLRLYVGLGLDFIANVIVFGFILPPLVSSYESYHSFLGVMILFIWVFIHCFYFFIRGSYLWEKKY